MRAYNDYRIYISKIFLLISLILFLILIGISHQAKANQPSPYLFKPTGNYAVSVQQYRWINPAICPDRFYRQADKAFYANSHNPDHCHSLNVYIFYPTTSQAKNYLNYNQDVIFQTQADLKSHKIQENNQIKANKYIDRLKNTTSYVLPEQPMVSGKFPLILFEPGWSFNVNNYQNFIVNLVSHGYIVAAIDSAYSATLTEKFGYLYRTQLKYIPQGGRPSISCMCSMLDFKGSNLSEMESDYSFVLDKIMKNSINIIADHVDFNHIGGMGHSMGAMAVYHQLSTVKAFISLDFGQSGDKPSHIYKPDIPSLIFRSAYDKNYGIKLHASNIFYLNKSSYLVQMTPDLQNTAYSKHSSFTDFETLISDEVLWKSREETYGNIAYPWYDSGSSYLSAKKSLGSGNGAEFTRTVNQYIVSFFDGILKNKPNNHLQQCKALAPNSQLYCGPAVIH